MKKRFVLIAGFAGNGKAFIGKQLIRQLPGYGFFHKDTISETFVEAMLRLLPQTSLEQAATAHGPFDRESQAYVSYVRPLEYACLLAVALENLALGTGAIVIAPFLRELCDQQWISTVTSQVQAQEATLKIIWVHADPDSTHERLIKRGKQRDIWKLAHWSQYSQNIVSDLPIVSPHFRIDNSSSPQVSLVEQLEQAKHFILH